MTTETPKRIQRNRLTHVNSYKLVQWLKDHPDIVQTMTKKALANKASEELGFSIDWSGMSDLARDLNIEIGLPKLAHPPKKKFPKELLMQQEIVLLRKWVEVLLRKTFNNPTESTMAWRELFGHFGPDSNAANEQPPLK
jgi:hypothetical protein